MKEQVIYKISFINSSKIYIGSAIDFKKRKKNHLHELRNNKHPNKILQNHYNKYGEQDLVFDVVECVQDKKLLLSREQFYIDSLNPEINILKIAGSRLGSKMSDATRLKMSISRKGFIPWITGKHHTDETKEIIRLKKIGVKQSEETVNKRISKTIGRKRTDECRKLLSELNKKRDWSYKIGVEINSKLKKHHQFIKDNYKTKTQNELAEILNIHQSTISKLLKLWRSKNII